MQKRIHFHRVGHDGAVILEYAVALVVFLILVFFIIDLSRVLLIRSLMFHGAHSALRLAKVIDGFDVDLHYLELEDIQGSEGDDFAAWQNFLARRNLIEQEALRVTSLMLAGSQESSGPRLRPLRTEYRTKGAAGTTDPDPSTWALLTEVTSDVAVLRPVESAYPVGWIGEDVPYPVTDEEGELIEVTSTPDAMRRYPIIVAMQAVVPSMVGIFPDFNLKQVAIGYREVATRLGTSQEIPFGAEESLLTPVTEGSSQPTPCATFPPPACPPGQLWNPYGCGCYTPGGPGS